MIGIVAAGLIIGPQIFPTCKTGFPHENCQNDNPGGLAGADARDQAADASTIMGSDTYRAWPSHGNCSPSTRFNKSAHFGALPDGTILERDDSDTH